MINLSALRGYVLEELLAALLRSSGYDLLVDVSQDPVVLTTHGNGLRVHGRGTAHQADVLGQLRLRIPFTLPIRLFVEAKNRAAPSGLGDVRNALGVVNDVNEHYSTELAAAAGHRYIRYQYRYALFSANGFTEDAQRFAIAQQISLVDLSGPGFHWLVDAANRLADAFLGLANSAGLESFPVSQMREALRRALGTWSLEPSDESTEYSSAAARARRASRTTGEAELPAEELAEIAAQAAEQDRRLYLGFTDSPLLLVLQPDDPQGAESRLIPGTRQVLADLRFAGTSVDSGDWALTTVASGEAHTYRLALPPLFEEELLERTDASYISTPGRSATRALTVALGEGETEFLFHPIDQAPSDDEAPVARIDYRRRARFDPDLAVPNDRAQRIDRQWTLDALQALLSRLRSEHRPHADIIEFAAANGGLISRDDVYRLARYPSDRMLKGFTRPPARITRDLIREGVLPRGVKMPLMTKYATGVVASHWTVPTEFTQLLG